MTVFSPRRRKQENSGKVIGANSLKPFENENRMIVILRLTGICCLDFRARQCCYLGYSVEMFLKAGLVKAYYGCSETMFDRDIKKRFRHKLVSMANEVTFSFNQGDERNLNVLMDMILFDARYPVFVPQNATYSDTVNQQTQRILSEQNFTILTELAKRIREHSKTIDADSDNPVSLESFTVDADGYLAFRIGGHLPPRITYRPSSIQRTSGKTSPDDMKALFRNSRFSRLRYYWHRAWIYEDGCTKTSCRAQPTT